jgi:hypothetical protein
MRSRDDVLLEALTISVECYAGYRGEETPRRFRLADDEVVVAEVLDQWLAPDHRYFKVLSAGGDRYILRHDVVANRWELTFFGRGPHAISEKIS